MATNIVVADLLKQEGCRTSVQFKEVELSSTLHDPTHYLPIRFYRLCNGSVRIGHNSILHEKHCKALSKCGRAAATLIRLLNDKAPASGHDCAMIMSSENNSASIFVGDTLAVADETFTQSEDIDCQSPNMFLSVEFRFPVAFVDRHTMFASTQYMHISSPTLKLEDPLFTEPNDPAYDHIEIVSGVCIFNGEMLKAGIKERENAGVDPSYIMRSKPTLYEMEYIARSSSAIADMASIWIARFREKSRSVPISVNLDVPSFQYYHMVIEKFDNGLCTFAEALEWMDAVDRRHDQIADVFTKCVQYELARRGATFDDYKIHTSSRANSVAFSIRDALRGRRSPELSNVLESLLNEDDGLWRRFYRLIPTKKIPRSWKELCLLFHVFEVIRSALLEPAISYEPTLTSSRSSDTGSTHTELCGPSAAHKITSKARRLIISIDESAERRLYSTSQEILKRIRSSWNETYTVLIEVYLCRRIFVNGNTRRTHLYHEEPTPGVPVQSYSSERDDGEVRSFEPFYAVRRLYGPERAENLQLMCAGVEL